MLKQILRSHAHANTRLMPEIQIKREENSCLANDETVLCSNESPILIISYCIDKKSANMKGNKKIDIILPDKRHFGDQCHQLGL